MRLFGTFDSTDLTSTYVAVYSEHTNIDKHTHSHNKNIRAYMPGIEPGTYMYLVLIYNSSEFNILIFYFNQKSRLFGTFESTDLTSTYVAVYSEHTNTNKHTLKQQIYPCLYAGIRTRDLPTSCLVAQ